MFLFVVVLFTYFPFHSFQIQIQINGRFRYAFWMKMFCMQWWPNKQVTQRTFHIQNTEYHDASNLLLHANALFLSLPISDRYTHKHVPIWMMMLWIIRCESMLGDSKRTFACVYVARFKLKLIVNCSYQMHTVSYCSKYFIQFLA